MRAHNEHIFLYICIPMHALDVAAYIHLGVGVGANIFKIHLHIY